ncbi:MAG TPA: ABC transporter substrate-binding protein [Pseudonocardia sp.]|uniref:ABC transporter substrate-binding protein n=1 Tax=Pseudonocardia sp. TaxID=60912 RepID=UPI002B4B72E6|nr:ABC transporter substrate-binding protein [Pseudonocardia sp.]HLU55899.1 ABC transporter substrate-binding protein [Pseudonocardia sp.]
MTPTCLPPTTPGVSHRARRAVVAVLTVAATLLATACGSSGEGTESHALRLLVPFTPGVWDPRQVSAWPLSGLLLVNEPLTVYQPDGTNAPNLAEKVEQPSPTQFVYTLRPGVTFSDGTAFTAEDVKFSFELHMGEDAESVSAAYWRSVASVDVTGENQVTVTLSEPDAQFPYTVSKTPIVSKAYYAAHGDEVGTSTVPNIGTGPYVFDAFTAYATTTLVPNPGYWGPKATYDSITLETPKDDSARQLALQSGEVDGIYNPPLGQLGSFQALPGFTSHEGPDLPVYRIAFDTTKAPFDDPAVRRAIMHAIDRQALVDGVFGGNAELAPTLVPESITARNADAAAVAAAYQELEAGLTHDIAAARDALAHSSRPDGFTVEVPVQSSDPNQSLIVQTIGQDLAEIGITVTVTAQDDATFLNAVYAEHSTPGMVVDSWTGSSPDPVNMPRNMLMPGSLGNIAQYANPAVTDLLNRYQSMSPTDPERTAVLLQALSTAQQDVPYVPLLFPKVFCFVRDDFAVTDFDTLWWMTRWPEHVTPAAP